MPYSNANLQSQFSPHSDEIFLKFPKIFANWGETEAEMMSLCKLLC